MPTAAFTTLGCKVNQYETQKILESFESAGFDVVPFDQPADFYVINTCSVTSDAERKSRYTIRRATRCNPDAKVIATGCAAQMSINKSVELEGAHLVVPNPEKLDTLNHVLRAYPNVQLNQMVKANPERHYAGRTRATLKVQDGCNVLCSYCSIPFTRPVMTSRPSAEVLAEAQALARMGYQEAILTGVLIGAYGPETGSGGLRFPELVRLIAKESGLPRIRISSMEMQQIGPEIFDLLAEGLIVPHLHIPLQCGDTDVLRDMNRPYTADDYLDLCDRLYRHVPGLSITADVMVGFPTETESRFENSAATVRAARYLKVHVFSFSPRFGTPADQYGDPVLPEEKARRRQVLTEISQETANQVVNPFLGRTLRVLVEGKIGKDGLLEGLSDNYLTVKFAGSPSLARTMQHVRLDEWRNGVGYGELVSRSSPGIEI